MTRLQSSLQFSVRPTTATHNADGINDAIIARCVINDSQLNVSVVDVGLSGHHMLTWRLLGRKVMPASHTVRCRPWSQLDVAQVNFSEGITSVPVHHVARRH